MKGALATIAALAAALTATAASHGTSDPRQVDDATLTQSPAFSGPPVGLVSDGRAFFAFKPGDELVRVYAAPRNQRHDVAVPARCLPVDLRVHQVLLRCTDATGHAQKAPLLLDVLTGDVSTHEPRGADADLVFSRVGRYWIEGVQADRGRGGTVHVFLSRRTGALLRFGDRRARDIDSRGLRRLPVTYAQRRQVHGRSGGWVLRDGPAGSDGSRPLVLRRAGRVPVVLSRCRAPQGPCEQARLVAGIASWRQTDRVYAYVPRTGERYSWGYGLAEHGGSRDDLVVAPLGQELIVAARRPGNPGPTAFYTIQAVSPFE